MSAGTMPPRLPDGPPLWRNVSFLLMWSSVAASGFGDRAMTLAALTLMGGNQQGVDGTSVQAGITFFFFLPYLLLGAPAGWLADRLPRKWIMLGCDESRGILLLLAFLLVPTAGLAAVPFEYHLRVLGIVAAVGVFAAIFNPSRNATIPQIVPVRQLQSANALIFGIAVIASMIGLGVGGLMIDPDDAGTVRTGLFVGSLFFFVSGIFFAFLKIRSRPSVADSGILPERRIAAMPYVRSHKSTWQLILVNMIVWGGAMVVYNAAVGLCKRQYGFAPEVVIQRYTVMAMLIGLGMLCGAAGVAWVNTRCESAGIAHIALLAAACCAAMLAYARNYYTGLTLAFGVGFFGNTTIICIATLLQAISPNYIRGRVMGLNTLATTVATVGINFVIWRTPNADTLIIGILKVTAMILAVAACWGLWLEVFARPTPSAITNLYWRLTRAYVFVWHRLATTGLHHVPSSGPVILAANHTTAIDPMLLQAIIPRIIKWVMLQRFKRPTLAFLWRVIEPIALKEDGQLLTEMRQMLRALEDGQLVAVFPEGHLQRDRRQLKSFRPGIGLIAKRSKSPIVPIWIDGTPLVRHMLLHFLMPSHSTLTVGQPYRPDPNMTPQQIADDLRQRLLQLKTRGERPKTKGAE